jgi:hypothetical protein
MKIQAKKLTSRIIISCLVLIIVALSLVLYRQSHPVASEAVAVVAQRLPSNYAVEPAKTTPVVELWPEMHRSLFESSRLLGVMRSAMIAVKTSSTTTIPMTGYPEQLILLDPQGVPLIGFAVLDYSDCVAVSLNFKFEKSLYSVSFDDDLNMVYVINPELAVMVRSLSSEIKNSNTN